jgi:3-dehydroquinate synthase class II
VQGPVHAYASVAGGATPYLSELESGSQVLVVDAKGNVRTVLVGRLQIESKPLVLVVVEVLQNLQTLLFIFFPSDYGGCYTMCKKH